VGRVRVGVWGGESGEAVFFFFFFRAHAPVFFCNLSPQWGPPPPSAPPPRVQVCEMCRIEGSEGWWNRRTWGWSAGRRRRGAAGREGERRVWRVSARPLSRARPIIFFFFRSSTIGPASSPLFFFLTRAGRAPSVPPPPTRARDRAVHAQRESAHTRTRTDASPAHGRGRRPAPPRQPPALF
jgi:hypothetical protein